MRYRRQSGWTAGIAAIIAFAVTFASMVVIGARTSLAQGVPGDDGPVSCSPGTGTCDDSPPPVYTPSLPQPNPTPFADCGTPPATDDNYVMQVYQIAQASYDEFVNASAQLPANDPRLAALYDQYAQNMHMFQCVQYFAGKLGPRPER